MGNGPNYSGQIANIWGSIFENSRADVWVQALIANASGISIGTNPAYTVNDLGAIYPFFLGSATQINGASTDGTTGVVSVPNLTGISIGGLITGPGIPNGSFVIAINTNTNQFTINNNTTASGNNVNLSGYFNPPIPFPIITIYIALASAAVNIGVYPDSWYVMMALFIAHWLTMWAMNNQSPNATLGQIAQSGIAAGIQIFKHAGDLSVNNQILDDLKGWGTYQLTSYGQQFASFAKVLGTKSMLVW